MARRRGNKWQADVKDKDGKRVRPTFDSKDEAMAWEDEARIAARRGLALPPVTRFGELRDASTALTLTKLFDRVYEEVWSGNASAADSYRNAQDCVTGIGENRSLSQITRSDLMELRHEFVKKGLKPATVNRKMAALSRMFAYAETNGLAKHLPRVDWLKEGEGRIRWVTAEEEKAMLAWADENHEQDHRDLWQVLMDTGLRVGEALSLRWDDARMDTRKIHLWGRVRQDGTGGTKNRRNRTVPMTNRVYRIIEDRKDGIAGYHETVFAGVKQGRVNDVWDKMKKALGLSEDSEFVPHCLRHTFCSRLVQRGVSLAKVQRLAGHRSWAMTLRYSHLGDPDLEDAITVLD